MKDQEYVKDVENVKAIMSRRPDAMNYLSPAQRTIVQALIRGNEGKQQQQTPGRVAPAQAK